MISILDMSLPLNFAFTFSLLVPVMSVNHIGRGTWQRRERLDDDNIDGQVRSGVSGGVVEVVGEEEEADIMVNHLIIKLK
jgi:hypothetical protein